MPIPFIAGAILGAAAVIAYNKKGACIKDKFNNFDADKFAKKAGEMTENAILKITNIANKESSKKASKKAGK